MFEDSLKKSIQVKIDAVTEVVVLVVFEEAVHRIDDDQISPGTKSA